MTYRDILAVMSDLEHSPAAAGVSREMSKAQVAPLFVRH